jgi:hypothetical protein
MPGVRVDHVAAALQSRAAGTKPASIGTTRPMYIDPTTGSLVLQFLAAGVLSVLAMVSRVREAFKSFFRMLIPRKRR